MKLLSRTISSRILPWCCAVAARMEWYLWGSCNGKKQEENGWDRTIALDNDILSHVPLMWQHLVNCHVTHFPTEVWRQVDAHLEQSSTEMIASRSNACFKPCPRRASKGCVWKWVYPKCNFNAEDDKPSTLGQTHIFISENKIASLKPEDLDSLRSPNSAGSLAKASFPCSSSCLAHGNPRLPGWKMALVNFLTWQRQMLKTSPIWFRHRPATGPLRCVLHLMPTSRCQLGRSEKHYSPVYICIPHKTGEWPANDGILSILGS